MTTRSVPATWLEIPKHFGRRPDATFRSSAEPAAQAAIRAAEIQHQAAVVVLDELARRALTLDWLAGQVGETADHLRRKLYGRVQAGLRDLCAWGVALEVETVRSVAAVVVR